MATDTVLSPVLSRQPEFASTVPPEWQIRNLFFTRLPGWRYVGIQPTYGVLPEGDLVLFQPASGTTLAVPLAVFSDPEQAIVLVLSRTILSAISRRTALPEAF